MSTNSANAQAGWWLLCALLMTRPVLAADLGTPEVRDHADQTFERFHQREQRTDRRSRIVLSKTRRLSITPHSF